jgi:tetratricopeptide (TPR) repeat protein
VRRDPEHAQARRYLAEYLTYAGEHEQAAGHFGWLLARDPGDAASLLGLARCRRLQGRADEARHLLAGLLDRDDAPVAALVEQAALDQDKADFRAAEAWYRRALRRDPFCHEACYGLAQCLRALKRPKEARAFEGLTARIERDLKRLSELREQMARAPEDPGLPCEAGTICLRNGQKDEARRWLRKALRLNPDHPEARRRLEQLVGH